MLTGGYFKATKPNVVNPHAVSVNGNKSRTVSRDMAIQPGSIENHSARTDNHEAPRSPQSTIDPSAYVDAIATSQPQVELETTVQQAPAALPASPDGHLTAVSLSSDANCLNYNPVSYGGSRRISYTGTSTFTTHISRLFHTGISTYTPHIFRLYETNTSVANSIGRVDVSSCIPAGVVLLFCWKGRGGERLCCDGNGHGTGIVMVDRAGRGRGGRSQDKYRGCIW
ncbi:hypothetical protein H0G86_000336 [Trichoderma simmonsii]|uniref:Uncharacterized protein n=1 Tax=Trichoderma simmonsii TaxID=1491479 RepID=A0A8G0PA43_9HYPO|nr:hypothetical protein H0G86_000336 [Trichoderma simmonsii]